MSRAPSPARVLGGTWLADLAGVSATPLFPPSSRSLRSRGCSRGCWTSSSPCFGLLPWRPDASCRTRWASWTTPCTCAAPAPQVGLPACPLSLPPQHPERGGLGAGASAQAPPLTWPPCLADYLVSRAQAALDAVSALEKGHAQYLTSRAGECHGHGPGTGQGRGQRPQAAVPTGHCCLRAASSGSHTLEPAHPLGLGSHRPWFGSCSAAL